MFTVVLFIGIKKKGGGHVIVVETWFPYIKLLI